ncbi:MAG: helix-turn-helix domain-containing protein [Lachnospiraceae bacterium]|nr:helix-turn-helix domain-containing protein [Lachnospiraceae bacterium]
MKTRIVALRKMNKISQEELANAVGVTRQTIAPREPLHHPALPGRSLRTTDSLGSPGKYHHKPVPERVSAPFRRRNFLQETQRIKVH